MVVIRLPLAGHQHKVDKREESLVYDILHGLAGLPSGQAITLPDLQGRQHLMVDPTNKHVNLG